jgi:diguanylate cyclase (GGDEF)-like protein
MMEKKPTTSYQKVSQQDKRILIVDDEMSLRTILSEVLTDDGYEITEAESGEEALECFRKAPYPLIITDIVMCGMSGIELLQEVKKIQPDSQVVIMTSNAALDTAITALRSGAYDYLIKPFEELNMISAVAHRAMEKRNLILENQELIRILTQQNEEMERTNITLKELAIRDGLTSLFNHRHFQEALAVELLRSQRHERKFSIILMDLDDFKNYNDTHGHPVGDQLLISLSELMVSQLRLSDMSARYGGEEFVIILPETSKEYAIQIAENMRSKIEHYPFKGREAQSLGKVTVSCGVASFPEDGTDGSSLIEAADRALYQAKELGRNRICHSSAR